MCDPGLAENIKFPLKTFEEECEREEEGGKEDQHCSEWQQPLSAEEDDAS